MSMELVSLVGSVAILTLLVAVVYWCIDTRLGILLGIAFLISNNIYSILKLAFHSPRPYWIDPKVKAWASEASFGFPSGHSLMAVSIWGILGVNTRKSRWIAAAILMIFITGISRMYLGVHFLSDVLAGWFLGFVLLGVIYALEKPVTHWISRRKPSRVFLAAASISLVFILLGYFYYSKLISWQFPGDWLPDYISTIHPVMLRDVIDSAGIFTGFAAGACWLAALPGIVGTFSSKGSWKQLTWRCVGGIAGILFLYGSLGMIIPHEETVSVWVLRFLRSSLAGFWISGLAPFIFIKTGLAGTSNR